MAVVKDVLVFTTPPEWRAWLQAHHDVESEVWLLISKKGAARKSLSLAQAVEEALCFGWIDSHMRPVDAQSYRLRFSPRRSGSVWAISNIRRVEKLIRQGRMTPAGLAAVDAAKASGEWDAAVRREDVSLLPPELDEALHQDAAAREAYHQLAPSLKKQYNHWITSAKRIETRHRRVQQLLEKLHQGVIMAKKQTPPQIKGGPNTALLIIDVQRGLFRQKTPIYHAEQLLDNIHTLARKAHQAEMSVVYVQHSAERQLVLGSPEWQLHHRLSPLPEDLLLDKLHGDAFQDTPLVEMLEARLVGTVVICGLVTQGCVRATSLGALQLGYQVIVAGDAHSSNSKDAAKLIAQWNAKLAEAGAVVRPVSEIEFEG